MKNRVRTKSKAKPKKPAAHKKRSKGKSKPVRERINIPKILSVAGVFLIGLALLLLISFFSYLFTWKADQDLVFHQGWNIWKPLTENPENFVGRLGAVLSHQFFYNFFGVASFIVPALLLVTGINAFVRKHVVKLRRSWLIGLYFLFFIPVVAAFFLRKAAFPWGGGYGRYVVEYFNDFVGDIGTFIILVALFFLGMIGLFNVDFKKLFTSTKNVLDTDSLTSDEEKEFIDIKQARDTDDLGQLKNKVIDEEDVIPQTDTDSDEFETVTSKVTDEKTSSRAKPKNEEAVKEDLDLELAEVKEEKQVDHYTVDTHFNPRLELSNFKFPTLELLEEHGEGNVHIDREELEQNKEQIIETLRNYKIEISKIKATVGPTVTLYEIVPAPGIRISKIKNLEDDIALSLAALGIRIIAPIPGKGTIGIEVPNQHKNVVSMKSMLASEKFVNSKGDLPVAVGKTISNENYIADLARMPHLLIAGATGQGKSVGINSVIISLLYKKHPTELKFVLIDPKKVELSIYKNIEKYYLAKLPGEEDAIITDTRKVINTLNALCIEMDNRYELLKNAHCRNIKEYNKKFIARKLNPENGHAFLPYIVLVIDEFADLIMTAGKEVEGPIARLAQLARAIGIHLIIATQRPSVNIITGIIKANFPARIAYRVMSKVDSRTILDMGGADQLIGRGDLILSVGSDSIRLQCPFVDTPEVDAIIQYIQDQPDLGSAFLLPEYVGEGEEGGKEFSANERDPMFEEAARLVVSNQSGSTSMIQRKLSLGYNRAGRIMDQLEGAGIVGPARGSKPREVLMIDETELEHFLTSLL